jgi:uncharacterized membrane protein (DUF485 family)
MNKPDGSSRRASDLASAVIVSVVYFAFMLTIGFAPQVFTAPIHAGSLVSKGLVYGIAMTVFTVICCAWYTHRRNSRENT